MLNIRSGVVREDGSGIWEIFESNGQVSYFQYVSFSNILDGAAVYFVDLNLDAYCENVQPKADLDYFSELATPKGGFQTGAKMRLSVYIMEALLASLRDSVRRIEYLASLEQKMKDVQTAANSQASQKVTIALLKIMGISGG